MYNMNFKICILVLGLLFIIKLELVKVREFGKENIEFINIIKTNFIYEEYVL